MATTGVYPPDTSTEIGRLRLAIGDTEVVTDNGDGTAEYEFLSDAQLSIYLSVAGDNVLLASGYAMQQIAALITASAEDWTSDDLKVNQTARADVFRRLARDILIGAQEGAAVADFFLTAGPSKGEVIPEGTYPINPYAAIKIARFRVV